MDTKTIQARRWYILGVLVICLLVVILDNTILNVALKTIQQDLSASQSQMEWAVNSYVLVFAGLLFTFGVLGDRFGRKRLLLFGIAMFGAASLATAFSPSSDWLIGLRALMGVGGAAIMPQTLSIITNVFDGRERAKAIAIWSGFSGLAIALGPVTGGLLLEHFWWGSIFLVNVPIAALAIVAILALIPESKDPTPKHVDPIGVVLSIGGMVALVYGIVKGGQTNEWGSGRVLVPLIGGLVLLAAFVLLERRSAHPALDVTLFAKPRFAAATTVIALVFFVMSGVTFYLSYYLQILRDNSPLGAGLLLVPAALGIMVTASRSAKLAARYGTKLVCAAGVALVTVSVGAYGFIGATTAMWIVVVFTTLIGAGMGLVMAPAMEAIMSTIPRDKAGAGSSITTSVRQLGAALGVAILGSILSATYRSTVTPSLGALPEGMRDEAGESIGSTYQAVGEVVDQARAGALPPDAAGHVATVIPAAQDAFIHGMHVASIWGAVVGLVGLAVVALFLPGQRAESDDSSESTAPVDSTDAAEVVV